MLLQLACSSLIEEVNKVLRTNGPASKPTATLNNLQNVLNRMVHGEEHQNSYYFDAVWGWLKPEEQKTVKKAATLAEKTPDGWISIDQFDVSERETLDRLVKRDVFEKQNGNYKFRVELMKNWITKAELRFS